MAKPKRTVYRVSFEVAFDEWEGEPPYSAKFVKDDVLASFPEAKKVKVEKVGA